MNKVSALILLLVLGFMPMNALGAADDDGFIIALDSAPSNLSPLYATDANGIRVVHLLYETLVRLDKNLSIAPGVASSWERVKPLEYRFQIRQKAKFSDGTPLSADDVVFSFNSYLDEANKSPYGIGLAEKIASIKALNSHEVSIELKQPFPFFLGDMILPIFKRSPIDNLIGSGAFVLVSDSPNNIVLRANQHYHSGKPALDKVSIKIIQDENTRMLKMRSKEVDLAINVLPLKQIPLFESGAFSADYRVLAEAGLSFQYLGFNLKDEVISDKNIRQAIAYALPVAELIEFQRIERAVAAVGLLPASSDFSNPDLKPYAHDIAKAKKLLATAGYSAANPLKLTYKTSTDRGAILQARVIKQALAEIGIEISIYSYEWGTFYRDIVNGDFQLYSLRWIGIAFPNFYYELLHSSKFPPNGRNRGRYENAEVDQLLERGQTQTDSKELIQIYREVERITYDELPFISMWHNYNVGVISRQYTGFELYPSGGFEGLSKVRPVQ